ncbi:SRPBCC family protein [Amycolatopsis sp. FDAARGOS 1241]|uniref:SRPBCC family protein n=1 Tax=Amycolatopsis sp. FDAARGOS 1241 TaxID=2778070 RepID=UPI00194DED07|nr:SRPBCC family protein [Amycolatopsis sp. FDAARGOS 1241]QRP44861.1 SRPBCC family protein [Amycolatopsis sp. FDAARGOS 1241]
MPGTELTTVFTVAAPPADVAAHLAEPENYVGLSPLVVQVRDIVREAGLTRYTAVERFRFLGFLRHDNPIAVTIRTTGSSAVHGEVVSPGGVRMGYRFDLEPDGAGTRVTDTLRLHTPPGLLRFAASRARAVQLARAGVLADRLG